MGDIVLGFDSLDGYLAGHPFFGAIVGRYGNRIAKGRFTLDGQDYTLATNNGPNHLHGGLKGFDKQVWSAEVLPPTAGQSSVAFTLHQRRRRRGLSRHADRRSDLHAQRQQRAHRRLSARRTDKATPVNLTQHSYFNLAGEARRHPRPRADDRCRSLHAGRRDADSDRRARAGRRHAVRFPQADRDRRAHRSAERAAEERAGLRSQLGAEPNGAGLRRAARVVEPKSGRTLEVATTEPGVQFYAGNFLDGTLTGKGGHVVRAAQRLLPRDAALSRFAEPAELPVDDA